MAKRTIDSNKWRDPFYRQLPVAYKLLWDFINSDCDNAGVWVVDMKTASINVTKRVHEDLALQHFAERIIVFDSGRRWHITTFVSDQYNELSPSNRFHKSVIDLLAKHNIEKNKGHARPLQGPKNTSTDKEETRAETKEGVQGENLPVNVSPHPAEVNRTFDFQGRFLSAFDELTMERYGMSFKGIDLLEELQQFRLKCDNDPMSYHHRDAGGLRNAFQHQLKTAKPKSPNGNIIGKKQHPAQSLAADHANKYGGTSA